MAAANMIETFNMTLPPEGPGAIPITVTFTEADEEQEIDLTQIVNDGIVSYISGVLIDNLDMNGGIFDIENAVTGQRIRINEGKTGTRPLLCPNPPKFIVRRTGGIANTAIVRLQFVNFPVFPSGDGFF